MVVHDDYVALDGVLLGPTLEEQVDRLLVRRPDQLKEESARAHDTDHRLIRTLLTALHYGPSVLIGLPNSRLLCPIKISGELIESK